MRNKIVILQFKNNFLQHCSKIKIFFPFITCTCTFNKFPDIFVQAFNIVVDSWKFSMLLLYILWGDWPIFIILGSNEQLQQQLEYTLLKPDCYSWWFSKMQSDNLEEQYAIKFCFKLGKKVFFNLLFVLVSYIVKNHENFKEINKYFNQFGPEIQVGFFLFKKPWNIK